MGEMPETRAQVIAQYRAVAHMAKALAAVHEQMADMFEAAPEASHSTIAGPRSAYIMETLGNILNGMEAVDSDEDAWLDPIFAAARRLWPQEPAHDR